MHVKAHGSAATSIIMADQGGLNQVAARPAI
jgi:hypothetical protein